MKICAISDLHGKLIDIPKCDVLAIAGDISSSGNAFWFENYFIPYLKSKSSCYDTCVLVFGNHDDKIQVADTYLPSVPDQVNILTNQYYKYKGVKFFGSPFCKKSDVIIDTMNTFDDKFLKYVFNDIPTDTDVLITHNPPYGFGDTVEGQSYHLGSQSLMDRVRIVKPKIHIFGHIHTGKKFEQNNGTSFYNVSVLDEKYNIRYKPTIINI